MIYTSSQALRQHQEWLLGRQLAMDGVPLEPPEPINTWQELDICHVQCQVAANVAWCPIGNIFVLRYKAPIRLMSQGIAMPLAAICLRLHLEASHCQRTCETLAEFLAHHVHRATLEFGNVVFITATTSDFNPRFVSKWHLKMDTIFALTHLARTTSTKSHVSLECGGLLHVQMPCVFMSCAFLMACVFQSLSILMLCVFLDFSYPMKDGWWF